MKIYTDKEVEKMINCLDEINWGAITYRDVGEYCSELRRMLSKDKKCEIEVTHIPAPQITITKEETITELMNQLVMDDIQYHNSRSKILGKIDNKVISIGKEVFGEDITVLLISYAEELDINVISEFTFISLEEVLDFVRKLGINFHDIRLDFKTDTIILKVAYPEVNQADDNDD